MTRPASTSLRHAAASALAVAIGGALCALLIALLPAAAAASPDRLSTLQDQAADVRRQVERLDQRSQIATEEYNAVRAELDELNIRLSESRRALSRMQTELDAAREQLSERLSDMYKSDGLDMFDVLFSVHDLSEVDTQLGYFRSINEADEDSVERVETMARAAGELTQQIENDRAEALEKELVVREKQAEVQDRLAQRSALLSSLDAEVKKLLAQQARLEAEEAKRLAREAGVDLAAIAGSPAQIGVIKETMKYLGIDYVWGGATPSGGFDCSGLVLYVYAKFGVDFPHGATMQAHMGAPVPLSKAQPADLVFFGSPSFYHHVGIYVGNGLFIEAPHTGDVVKVSKLAGRGCTLICRYPLAMP